MTLVMLFPTICASSKKHGCTVTNTRPCF